MVQYYYDLADYPIRDTIKMMTWLLQKIIKANDTIQPGKSENSDYHCFYAKRVPSIDIQSYFNRIFKYCPCPNECFLSLLVYFDRLSRNTTGLRINSYNIHRLIISGIMVANKFFSDTYYTNARFAKVGGLSINELNLLEFQFLKLNNFQLFVKVEELQTYGNQLLCHCIKDNQYILHYYSTNTELLQQCSTKSKTTSNTNQHHVSDHFESIPNC